MRSLPVMILMTAIFIAIMVSFRLFVAPQIAGLGWWAVGLWIVGMLAIGHWLEHDTQKN